MAKASDKAKTATPVSTRPEAPAAGAPLAVSRPQAAGKAAAQVSRGERQEGGKERVPAAEGGASAGRPAAGGKGAAKAGTKTRDRTAGLVSVAESLPALGPEASLQRYLQEIRKFPMLSPEEEYMLAKAWVEHKDVEAAHKLVTSHLRLVAKIAMGYRGYGLPLAELIAEGNVGMMQAVKRFDPDKGFRLATYAMWWIRAAIQEYILRSWSLVKLGTTAAQKKLFFNLRRIKSRIEAFEEGDLKPEEVRQIAEELGVPEEEVISMNRRMAGGDHSLNAPLSQDGDGEWQDWLTDESPDQEEQVAEAEEFAARHKLLEEALKTLNERERHIFIERRLSEEPKTLEELSKVYGVSRERIRQIEVRAFEKVQKAVRELARKKGLLEEEA
ncbi:MAG: RNA polymerase sigma factor RpoH, partial [Alphaproteobacteria bacterium]